MSSIRSDARGCATAVFAAVMLVSVSAAAASREVERGNKILRVKGCTACHSTDGMPRVGPTFRGAWGTTRTVETPAGPKQVVMNEAYVARSLRDPDGEVASGFPKGNMPRFDTSDVDVTAVAAALKELASAPEPGTDSKSTTSIVPLAIAAAAFALLHFLLSSIPVRTVVIGKLGQKAFAGLYSLAAFASFGAMIWFYRMSPYIEIWQPPRWTRWVPILVMPVALLFMVTGFSTPSPTMVGAEKKAKDDPIGIQAVTRHPALWGFAFWALAHLATNGELDVILVALSILVLSIGGMMHIDARRRAQLGDSWTGYASKTSLVPFAAIAGGRAKLNLREIGIVRVLLVAFFYTGILHTHALVIGASPFP